MKLTVGITGLSGAGKSTVSALFKKNGFHLIDADKKAREVLEKGTKGLSSVIEKFGEEYLNSDGSLNRKKLGETVFSDKEKLKELNNITLPIIISEMTEEVRNHNGNYILIDAPLLLDCELKDICDEIVYVYADNEILIERIIQRDSTSRENAEARLSCQKNDEYFRKYATIIIENNDNEQELEKKVGNLICQLKNRNY